MNIVLIGPSLNQRGGIVSVLQVLRDFLVAQGTAVRVVGTTAEGSRWQGVLVFLRAWVAVLGVCLLRKTDVVHLNMASRGSCLRKSVLGLTCWIFRIPFVIHLHGGGFQTFRDEELGRIGRTLVDFVFRRAARVIALSVAWQAWLQTTMKLKDVAIVFNGVPSYETKVNVERKTTPTVLFLGRLGTNKGTDVLIAAMREVTRQLPNAVLELGGDGDIATYRQQAADLPNVRFLGWVDDSGRRAALARATVYCLPSWKEGLPLSVLEAMSAGLPVVSTPVGGIPEAVEDGVSGLLVQPGDAQGLATALSKILLNPAMAKSMGDNGRLRQREQFSAEAMGHSCLEVYSSCINN